VGLLKVIRFDSLPAGGDRSWNFIIKYIIYPVNDKLHPKVHFLKRCFILLDIALPRIHTIALLEHGIVCGKGAFYE
jgi:hypothetical protein